MQDASAPGLRKGAFRANTVALDGPARPEMFARFLDERSVLCSARLIAGDFLYLPARWWHMAL